MTLTNIIRGVAVAGGVFSFAIVAIVGDHANLAMIGLALFFAAWSAAPYVLIYLRAPEFDGSQFVGGFLLIVTVAAVIFAVAVYWTTFIDNSEPDAQDGLVLVFVPLYQLAGVWLSLVMGRLMLRYK